MVFGLTVFALLGVSTAARLSSWRSVFGTDGQVELVPADSHYYLRFARLQLEHFPRFVRFDPYVNFPTGAEIYWPPLHPELIALGLQIFGVDRAERVAAWVDPTLALLELLAVLLLARRVVGEHRALLVGVGLALLPAAVQSSMLGNADHHVHEPMFIAASCLAFGAALATGSAGRARLAGFVVVLAGALNPMAFVVLPLLGGSSVVAAWLEPSRARRFRVASAHAGLVSSVGFLVLAAVFGPLRSVRYEILSGFQPLLAVLCFAGAIALIELRATHRVPLLWTGIAAAAAAPLVVPLVRAGSHFARADPLLSVVTESEPLWRDPQWLVSLLSVGVVVIPLCGFAVVRRLLAIIRRAARLKPGSERDAISWPTRRSNQRRAPVVTGDPIAAVPALVAAFFLLGAALFAQARFIQAFAGAAAVLVGFGWPWIARTGASPRLRFALRASGALLALVLVPQVIPQPRVEPPNDVARVRPMLRWMREHTPPASSDPLSMEPPAYGVAASWMLGHFITLWAERPELASTFSQAPAHLAGNQRAGAILTATSDEKAWALAQAAGARYVLVTPSETLVGFPDFDRPHALLTWLLDDAGMTPGRDSTAHFRLVHDSAEQRLRPEGGSYARLFEAMPGAIIEGTAAPSSDVLLTSTIHGPDRSHRYERKTQADSSGHFDLRVAYPTQGGEWRAAPYVVRAGDRVNTVQIDESAVREGRKVMVSLDDRSAEAVSPR